VERESLRETFDEAAESYDRSRLVAPTELFEDLVALARLEPGAKLLEIGCGTGQATLPLAERGFDVLGIELGESLAAIARARLASFPVRIVTGPFEGWDPAGERFDAVVAFNSFHWLDPEVRFTKSAEVLLPGGALGVMGSAFVEHDAADPTWLALQEDYRAVVGEAEPRQQLDAARDRRAEFEETGHFHDVVLQRYHWDVEFSAEGYVERLETSSWHRKLPDDVRAELFDRLRRRIGAGSIRVTTAAVLYVAFRI
jgi:cyclopropane fatty-acyl-phospholipid synthase-like methyltransferase